MKRTFRPVPILTLAFSLAFSSVAFPFSMIDGGTLGFLYAQFPSGPYGGSFAADGELLHGVPVNGGTTAVLFDSGGLHYLVVVAGLVDGGSKVDAAAVLIKSPTPFTTAAYPVDPIGGTCTFAFVDDVVTFALPADPATADWEAWFQDLVASRRFVGATGQVTLTAVSASQVSGTFSGLSLEYGTNLPVAITSGAFSVTGALPVEATSWGGVKADYRD